jgi:tRNA pseudouridine38-40 synthase
MQSKPFAYLFFIQYLGLRYHGWQKQPGIKTIQGTLERVFKHVLGHDDFNILAAGRTDAGVSCQRGAFELFSKFPLEISLVLELLNENLPDDIRILEGKNVPLSFNIIQDVEWKEYRYSFASGKKFHPFLAGNCSFFLGQLDVEKMKEVATLFIGTHDFRRFCSKSKEDADCTRVIFQSELVVLPSNEASRDTQFFQYQVRGKGFMMHQVRLMAGTIIEVGKGKLTLNEVKEALMGNGEGFLSHKPPANGLVLEDICFKNEMYIRNYATNHMMYLVKHR